MDSKQIFRTYQSKFDYTNWLNKDGEIAQNEGDINWIACGLKADFKHEVVSQAINDVFSDDEVYLSITSNKSMAVTKAQTVKEIGDNLHKKEMGIINKSCTKLMHFSTYGVFSHGIIREFPKSRQRPINTPLKVAFHANIYDSKTQKVSDAVSSHFENLGEELSNDYGGSLENLWIDLELVESHVKDRESFPFRFQKRVNIPSSYTEFYSYNVGHYSVKPDFEKLKELTSKDEILTYILTLMYDSTQVLVDKQKKLGGFNAEKFRSDFLDACGKYK